MQNRKTHLEHILGTSTQHKAWHSSYPKRERECPFCEKLDSLALYMGNRPTKEDIVNIILIKASLSFGERAEGEDFLQFAEDVADEILRGHYDT